MARGDIVTVELPAALGQGGHEQAGQRPAIVVQTDVMHQNLSTTMVVPLTSNLKALSFPHTFLIDPSRQNGLVKQSVLLVFQLRAIDKRRYGNRIGRLEGNYLQQLETEMRDLLGL